MSAPLVNNGLHLVVIAHPGPKGGAPRVRLLLAGVRLHRRRKRHGITPALRARLHVLSPSHSMSLQKKSVMHKREREVGKGQGQGCT